ncbi:MAG TPA: PA14 domain-containing protein [Chryseosolibacter sp.]
MKPTFIILLALVSIEPFGSSAQSFNHGIKADYYNGIHFNHYVLTRIEKHIGFSRELKSPARGVGKEYFSIRYSGSIIAPRTGLYNFYVLVDDGVRVWVNHQLIIDAWIDQEATSYSGTILLDEGETYDIEIEYYNTVVHSVFNIRWELPVESYELFDLARQPEIIPIPTQALKPTRSNPKQRQTLLIGRAFPSAERSQVEEVATRPAITAARRVNRSARTIIVENEPIILKTVVFDQQSAVLRSEASLELDNLIKYLKTYEAKKIQIAGYTDYLGDSLDNQTLSEERAKTVARYLVKGGIDEKRISSQGFGGRFPLIVSKNLNDRRENRRVEFTIVD